MLGAGANTLPPALLFLALGALAFAVVPRASPVIAYGLVGLAFVWELFGALLEVPAWLLAVSPFHDVGLVPGEPFEAGAAAVMLALAASVTLAALWAFRRRDLCGA
jgi:polyether ionophore transport system permease protein